MKKNNHPDFVGIAQLKEKHRHQIEQFSNWAKHDQWEQFHNSHYDWWTFPIDKPSAYGYAYTIFEDEIATLRQDPDFLKHFLLGAELLLRSWGWDLKRQCHIEHPLPAQVWQNWPIRLHKCANSLLLFGFTDEFASVKQFANTLMHEGVSFEYRGRDLSELFL